MLARDFIYSFVVALNLLEVTINDSQVDVITPLFDHVGSPVVLPDVDV